MITCDIFPSQHATDHKIDLSSERASFADAQAACQDLGKEWGLAEFSDGREVEAIWDVVLGHAQNNTVPAFIGLKQQDSATTTDAGWQFLSGKEFN